MCRHTSSTFLADSLCSRKKWNSFHWGYVPIFKTLHSLLAFWCNTSIFFPFWLLPLSSIMSVEKFWNEAEKYLKHFSSCFRTSCLKKVMLNLCIHSLNTQVPKLIRKVNSLFMAVVSLMSASRYSHSLLCIPW